MGPETTLTYTREAPEGWTGATGRLDAALLGTRARIAYVCGSSSFVDAVADLLLEAGLEPGAIRTERIGA